MDSKPAEQTFTITLGRGTAPVFQEVRTLTRAELWARLGEHRVEPVKTNAESFIPGELAPCGPSCTNAGTTRVDCGGGRLHRLAANMRSVSLFVADIDKQPEAQVRALLAVLDATGLAYVYSTTYSHRPPEQCSARIIFPLSRPYQVTNARHWRTVAWPALMRRVGIDPETVADKACSDPSRLYFLPSVPNANAPREVILRDGDPIDTDSLPVAEPQPHLALVAPIDTATVRRSATRDAVLSRVLAEVDREEDLALLDAVASGHGFPEGERHAHLNRAVWLLCKHTDADDASIMAVLAPSLTALGDERDFVAETERSIEGARVKLENLTAEDIAFAALQNERSGKDRGYAARWARLNGAETRCLNGDFYVWTGQLWEGGATAQNRIVSRMAYMADTYEQDLAELTESLRVKTERLQALGPAPIGLAEAETREFARARQRLAESVERLQDKVDKFRSMVIDPLQQTRTIRNTLDQVKGQVLSGEFDSDPRHINCNNGGVTVC